MNTSPLLHKHAAIIAGIAYLIAIFGTPYGWINPLIIVGDAKTTFSNITANELLFRLAIVSWLVVIVADAVVGWALFYYFRAVNRAVSLLAMCLRFAFVPVMALAVFQWMNALTVIAGAGDLTGDLLINTQKQSMFFFVAYEYAVNIAFMIFGLHVGLIGYLSFRSGYVPRILGILLMTACIGYQIDTFASIMSQEYNANPTWFLVTIAAPAFLSEFMLTIWLLVKGSKIKKEIK